jgi:hypothetical protein
VAAVGSKETAAAFWRVIPQLIYFQQIFSTNKRIGKFLKIQ